MQDEMSKRWEVPVSISLTPKIMLLSLSFPSFDSFNQMNNMKEKINQAEQKRDIKYKNMSKPYLTSTQITDDCGHQTLIM